MLLRSLASLAILAAMLTPQQSDHAAKTAPRDVSEGPSYTSDRQFRFPAQYREWVYLGSGVDMSYDPKAQSNGHSMFNTVFVNPSSYREFLKFGTWPDGTTLVLENCGAVHGGEVSASLNKHGLTQTGELMGMEIHVKDASLPGKWGFFAFDDEKSAKLIGRPASCYTCHEQHAAVDTTFAQFYPILFPIAKSKGKLSKEYLAEIGASKKP